MNSAHVLLFTRSRRRNESLRLNSLIRKNVGELNRRKQRQQRRRDFSRIAFAGGASPLACVSTAIPVSDNLLFLRSLCCLLLKAKAVFSFVKTGGVQFLCNFGVLTTGFDAAKTQCILL